MSAQVFDGKTWVDVEPEVFKNGKAPIPPVLDGDGKIFVSMPSFRDGKRCGLALKSLFENAADPHKIVVGLIEQNDPQDRFCLEEYCSFYKVDKFFQRRTIRKDPDVIKLGVVEGRKSCPHLDQVRWLSFHNLASKGPSYARSMTRKILGNEEFCLQIDTHTDFVKDWDKMAKRDWINANNEFAILSTTPKSVFFNTNADDVEVPKQCLVTFLDQGIPYFKSPGDGKATNLEKPLLSHTWSPGFSFAKCHLEESAPYDPHTPYVMHVEQFARFARFWTRGYDVYTPTRNFLFHNYDPNPDKHGINEWFQKRKERQKIKAVDRLKSFLQIPDVDTSEVAQANLGIYGLGKRRTLQQLMDFVGIDIPNKIGNKDKLQCANFDWVWYDPAISPIENLFSNPDDLDFQPEYPLRTSLTFYKQEQLEPSDVLRLGHHRQEKESSMHQKYPFPSAVTLGSLWVFGLLIWCVVCMTTSSPSQHSGNLTKKSSGNKDIKDV